MITKLVDISINIVGDGSSTSFTVDLTKDLVAIGNPVNSSFPVLSPGFDVMHNHPVSVFQVLSAFDTPTATVDSHGIVTVSFTTALGADSTTSVTIRLQFA